jgi:hypothetical protein
MNRWLKKQTLWIFLFPAMLMAQEAPVFRFDMNKKKNQETEQKKEETPAPATYSNDEEEEGEVKKEKKKKVVSEKNDLPKKEKEQQEEKPDFRNGLFKGLFIGGLNATQIDGDEGYGYNYLGAHVGVGAMVKFHKNMSVSMEILYSMKGAQRRLFGNNRADSSFKIIHDYVEVPLLFNVHDKKLIMASVGISAAYMVRNKLMLNGIDYTNPESTAPIPSAFLIEPKKFDLSALIGLHFIIKEQFALGARFSYSLLGIRPALPGSRVRNQYNNVLSFRFMYILSPKKKK